MRANADTRDSGGQLGQNKLMREREFEYGVFARGAYTAMIGVLPVVVLFAPAYALYYLGLLLFLGFGLRYVLEITGLHNSLTGIGLVAQERMERKFLEKRRREIDLKQRDEKYRKSHRKDSRLPKNW